MQLSSLYFYFEIIGTIAFSISGVIVGINKKMDVFGNTVLALITAVGGGMIRDIMLGITPPTALVNPIYVVVAFITSIITMIVFKLKNIFYNDKLKVFYKNIMFWSDSLGLGIFTVLGSNVAINLGYEKNIIICVLVGTLTGVGGGAIRDMMANDIPFIFTKHIYAVSCIIGSSIYMIMLYKIPNDYNILISSSLVFIIRIVCEKYKINLPKI